MKYSYVTQQLETNRYAGAKEGLFWYFKRCFFILVKYCDVLQVILTPTCRVSGYPRQVIEVDAA
jgi:hypothetical protein